MLNRVVKPGILRSCSPWIEIVCSQPLASGGKASATALGAERLIRNTQDTCDIRETGVASRIRESPRECHGPAGAL